MAEREEQREFFSQEGHLTPYALESLTNEEDGLDDLSRLELAEHLSFCDDCIANYMDLLSDAALHQPAKPLVKTVMRRLKTRVHILFFNKYVMMGVAACLAMVLWVNGAFFADVSGLQSKEFKGVHWATEQVVSGFAQATNRIPESVSNFFSGFGLFGRKGLFGNEKK